jgi:hypothetical protein
MSGFFFMHILRKITARGEGPSCDAKKEETASSREGSKEDTKNFFFHAMASN